MLCVQHGGYRNLTEGELRYEAMQTLAHGGKGVLWFTYWSPANSDHSFQWSHAMINPDGTRDPHYDMVRKINFDVRAIGNELLGAESTEVLPPLPAANTPAIASPVTLGAFKSKDGGSMALVASRDYKQAIDTQVFVAVSPAKVKKFEPGRHSWASADAQPKEGKAAVSLHIAPGGAILLKW